MNEFIKIDQVAVILGISEAESRIVARFHGVETKKGDQAIGATGRPFGNPCNLFNKTHVEAVAKLKGKIAS